MNVITPEKLRELEKKSTLKLAQLPACIVKGAVSSQSPGSYEVDAKDKASMTSKTEDGKASTLINKNPAAFTSRKSSNEDSLQLSLNDTQEKFRSLEVVKSLHKEGDHVKDKHSEGELGQLYAREQSVQRAANSSNLLINSDGEEDTSHRQSTELENLRYLSFARKDSENSIVQI